MPQKLRRYGYERGLERSENGGITMWTLIWLDLYGIEHYDRFDTREETRNAVEVILSKGWSMEDMLAFPPDTEIGVTELLESRVATSVDDYPEN
jgi:hypothetical protein